MSQRRLWHHRGRETESTENSMNRDPTTRVPLFLPMHGCKQVDEAFVSSYSAACSESVRSRGDTLNIIDTSACNDNARDNKSANNWSGERKRSLLHSRWSGIVDDRYLVCLMNRGRARRNARNRTRKHSVLAPYRSAKYSVAQTIISVFATVVVVQLRFVRSSRVISRGFRGQT